MVNFVDTCVLTNLLNIPGFNQNYEEVKRQYDEKVENMDTFVLPIATLVETGNHIAQCGGDKYRIAEKFKDLVLGAMCGENSFTVTPEITLKQIEEIMGNFPNAAIQGHGFGDMSILQQFEDYWEKKQPIGQMCIWSLDHHLNVPIREGGLKRRKGQ